MNEKGHEYFGTESSECDLLLTWLKDMPLIGISIDFILRLTSFLFLFYPDIKTYLSLSVEIWK